MIKPPKRFIKSITFGSFAKPGHFRPSLHTTKNLIGIFIAQSLTQPLKAIPQPFYQHPLLQLPMLKGAEYDVILFSVIHGNNACFLKYPHFLSGLEHL